MSAKIICTVVVLLAGAVIAHAHTPLCGCFDNGDNTITCEGGFSDGSSAAGVTMRVAKSDGGVLLEGIMNDDSEFTFEKPQQDYVVLFDGGDAHIVTIQGKEIVE
jgi:hypothetical protein